MNVINPIWFYLCDVFNIVNAFTATAAGLIGLAWLLTYAIGWCLTTANASLGEDDCDYKAGLALKATANINYGFFCVTVTFQASSQYFLRFRGALRRKNCCSHNSHSRRRGEDNRNPLCICLHCRSPFLRVC